MNEPLECQLCLYDYCGRWCNYYDKYHPAEREDIMAEQTVTQTLDYELHQLGFDRVSDESAKDKQLLHSIIEDAKCHGFEFIQYISGTTEVWYYREKC